MQTRWLVGILLIFAAGCSTTREFTVTPKPADATIKVDGAEVGRGTVKVPITFNNSSEAHTITASRCY